MLKLVHELGALGIETSYLGRQDNPAEIVAAVAECNADAIELCLSGGASVMLLRELLRELARAGRRDVSLVVHRLWT
jgi:methylmalonyl-CoA mutase cobalamin-binding subunit